MTSPRIGFIGIGAMGEPMVLSLRRAGFSVRASAHRNRERLERVLAAGVVEAADPQALSAESDVVITCVPDAPQVEEALFGPHGAAEGAARGTLFIDMSTISPVATQLFAQRLEDRGCRFVDAPVSGGPARAATGELTIMVGGSPSDFDAARPILEAMGTPYHLGGVGLGETVKLVNQLIIANVMIANAEALTFAQKAGADLDAVRKVLATATASNYLLEQWLPKTWFAGTFQGGFALDLLRKDLGAALDAGRAMKMPMPASALAYQLYTLRSAEGDGMLDYSSVAKFYEHVAGD
ncbi:MAG TPA: NAD(P)-dependent oxidoreductase [Candidatus Baltobacteraceae bacterium]|nr:NAD(P)-dependent oxidoreductase [Candidatus Baltobacteraceae bacterium]